MHWPPTDRLLCLNYARLQAIDRLRLDTKGPGRPRALGMESSVGTEYVAFKTPLPLEGKVGWPQEYKRLVAGV